MGSLEKVGDRWPQREPTNASRQLSALTEALPKNDTALDDFVAREILRDQITIGEVPSLPDVSPIRELLLKEQVVWERHDELGDSRAIAMRAMHMTMARALVGSALNKARANDSSAWDDLQAVWKLARSLDNHPQLMTQTAALAMARMVNAVAWKMPLPAPEWLGELQARDNVRPLLDAFQHQAANYWKSGARFFRRSGWQPRSIMIDKSPKTFSNSPDAM